MRRLVDAVGISPLLTFRNLKALGDDSFVTIASTWLNIQVLILGHGQNGTAWIKLYKASVKGLFALAKGCPNCAP